MIETVETYYKIEKYVVEIEFSPAVVDVLKQIGIDLKKEDDND